MQRGLLSHTCCCGHDVYNLHIVMLDTDNTLLSIKPFSEETAHTTFVEGLIIVTDSTFELESDKFVDEILQALTLQPHITLTQAVHENSIYNRHQAQPARPCSVYNLSPIAWHSLHPSTTNRLTIKKII